MKKRISSLLLMATALFVAGTSLVACVDDVENEYASLRAFFRFTPVTAAPQLYTSVNNPGQFCSVIYSSGSYYVFTDAEGNGTQYTLTQLDKYTPLEAVSGLVIGMPSVPDLSGNFPVVCYDLVCPNCYSESAITRRLSFSALTEMECGRCHRKYDLNNGGLVIDGEQGRKLYRYRVNYNSASNALVVQN